MNNPGTLTLVPTPIGNLSDITLRAIETLKSADTIACEDTRRTGMLLKHLEIGGKKLLRFFEHNEIRAAQTIVSLLTEGKNVALCTDGGMPSVSDPGFRAVTAANEAELPVVVLPGPNAALVALVACGLPVSSFTFKGFAPRKSGRLRKFLEEDRDSRHTLIFYESPYRVGKFLAAALETLGDRPSAVCRELTKLHEEIKTGSLSELCDYYSERKTKGEVTIVIKGKDQNSDTDDDSDDDSDRD